MRSKIPAILLLTAIGAAGQTLTPRELFYSDPRPAPRPAPKVQPAPPKNSSKPKPPTPSRPSDPDTAAAPPNNFVTIANRPLGLKYSVQKLDGREWNDADPDTAYVSGDHIRLMVESSDAAYLYVVTQGSSGNWEVRHPSAGVDGGSDRVQRGMKYLIPPGEGKGFTLRDPPGREKIFIVLARQKEPDLERLIYSLQEHQQKPKSDAPPPMLAINTQPMIDDALVRRMREMNSRDLVIEKIDEASAPPKAQEAAQKAPAREKAIYVVNPAGGGIARVVADIELRHK